MESRTRHRAKHKKVSHKKCPAADPLEEDSSFDQSFKYYKQRVPLPDFNSVINPSHPELWDIYGISKLQPAFDNVQPQDLDNLDTLGLSDLNSWTLLQFHKHPGLVFILNPFTSTGQQKWIQRSLQEYTKRPPYKLNLDAHPEWQVGNGQPHWWDLANREDERSSILKKKLRWSTLGYHHDWDSKVYSDENRSLFPTELAELSRIVAGVSGFEDFQAEAAIANYYHFDSTLAGHTDHSEQDLSAPLLSFSFGQDAIFLLGGPDKKDHPLPLLVQSGDVVIMFGASRLSYHGVPRIMPITDDLPRWQRHEVSETETNDWHLCCEYLRWSRINLNVRQVKCRISGQTDQV